MYFFAKVDISLLPLIMEFRVVTRLSGEHEKCSFVACLGCVSKQLFIYLPQKCPYLAILNSFWTSSLSQLKLFVGINLEFPLPVKVSKKGV